MILWKHSNGETQNENKDGAEFILQIYVHLVPGKDIIQKYPNKPNHNTDVFEQYLVKNLFLSYVTRDTRHEICQKAYTGVVFKDQFYPKVRKSQWTEDCDKTA